jgi:signal peptidase II
MFYIIIILIVIGDQLTKGLIQQSMVLNQSIPVWDGIFSITYIHNTGAAFSMLAGKTQVLALFQVIIIGVILGYYILKGRRSHPLLRISLAMIVAGGIGNLIDRLTLGYVVDFLDFHFWPIFNVADIGVSAGCVLLAGYVFFIEGKEKSGRQI